jgi:hypothetical protein
MANFENLENRLSATSVRIETISAYTENEGPVRIQYTVNVWFQFMYSQKTEL